MVQRFAELSGDFNLLHMDSLFAKRTPFKNRIAHGIIILAKISALLTKKFGDGNILISENIKFIRPVYINETITLKINKVIKYNKGINVAQVSAINSKEEIVLECEAKCNKIYIKNGK